MYIPVGITRRYYYTTYHHVPQCQSCYRDPQYREGAKENLLKDHRCKGKGSKVLPALLHLRHSGSPPTQEGHK